MILLGHAIHFGQRVIDLDETQILVQKGHAHGRTAEEGVQALVAQPDLGLQPLPLGNVCHDAGNLHTPSAWIPHQPPVIFNIHIVTVFVPDPIFQGAEPLLDGLGNTGGGPGEVVRMHAFLPP